MFSAVASGIFAVRNADKTKNGEVGRSVVTLGQTAGVVKEIAKYDNVVANTARSAVSVFSNLAKQNKAFEYAGKFTQFAVDNVNPLICASGVIKTAMAEDKVKTGVTEVAALSAMFAGEGLIKLNYDKLASSKTVKDAGVKLAETKAFKPLFEYLTKNKMGGKVGTVVKGLAFVGGSMTSYAIGKNIGEGMANRVEANLGLAKPQKINQMT